MAIDAAARIPAGVGLARVVHAHGYHVHAGREVTRDVVRDAAVTVGTLANVGAVDPHFAVHVDAIELEPGHFAARARYQRPPILGS